MSPDHAVSPKRPDPDHVERSLLIAENERLRAILADEQNLRGSRLVGVLAAASRSVAGRWLKRLVTRGPSQQGAPFAWSWSQENGPDRDGLCDLSETSPFFSLVAERGRDVVTVVHPNWRGVRSSAENLFDCRLYIDAIGNAQAALLAQRLHDAGVERVVFHGLPMTHERLVRALRRFSPKTRLFVIWHGNFMQLDESTDWHGLRTIIDWAREGVIERVGFVKQGMAEVFARQGIPTGFIQNYVRHLPAGPSAPMEGGPHLGLWAVEPIWRKLPYTMIAGAALVPGATVWAAGLNRRAEEVASLVRVPYRRLADGPIPQADMPTALARMHINLYVTLSECAPMLPLESLAAGVPCLVGPTVQYWRENPLLQRLLVTPGADRPDELAAYVVAAIEARDDIVEEYRDQAAGFASQALTRLRVWLDGP